MKDNPHSISACLVVYNEDKVIDKCLESIKNLVDEIIIVHDGECKDATLEIARQYTDKIFVQEHVGMMEGHLVFAFDQATSEWILRIDADEYFDREDIKKIKELVRDNSVDGYQFRWEMWDGKRAIRFQGLQKLCLSRRAKMTYMGIPHEATKVAGRMKNINLVLHHRPAHNNIVWRSFLNKAKKWVPVHATYFFPELVEYHCFNTTIDSWVAYTKQIRKHPLAYMAWYPLKNFLGQMKNGLWKTRVGVNIALQQYIYYLMLYWKIWQTDKTLQSRSSEGTA